MSLKVVFVTNSTLSQKNIVDILKNGVMDRIDAILLRENAQYYAKYADEIIKLCDSKNVEFITHNLVNFALSRNLKNIHFSFETFKNIDKNLLKNFISVNVSIHDKQQLNFVTQKGATSLTFGNIFETNSHPNKKGVGLMALESLIKLTTLDIYAIGGINFENIGKFENMQINGVCMMREFMR